MIEYEKNKVIIDNYEILSIKEHKRHVELRLKNEQFENIEALLKDNTDIFLRTFKVKDQVICKSKIRKRTDHFILDLIYIKKHDGKEKEEKQADVKIDNDAFIKVFEDLISQVKDVDYKKLLEEFFSNDRIKEEFFLAPAAKRNHHNYPLGLLQHTVEVTQLAIFIGNYYENINLDLLITGCILHDIGKMRSYEYVKGGEIQRTNWDELLGHLAISAIFVSKMMPEDFDSSKAMMLYHLILSHHGRLEYGSPVTIKMKEAEILHRADMISSSLNHIDMLEFKNNWTEFDKLTNKRWFRSDI